MGRVLGRDPRPGVLDGKAREPVRSADSDPNGRRRLRVQERVLDEGPPDLQHALRVGESDHLVLQLDLDRLVPPLRDRRELLPQRLCELPEVDRLPLDAQLSRVDSREVEQLRRQLRETCDLLSHRLQELAARPLVELLLGEQLEEARKREERGPQLVRRVRHELASRVLEPCEPQAHALERPRELSHLVSPTVDDRLVEATARDPLGGLLEAPQPAREGPSAAVAEQQRPRERAQAGEQEPALDEVHVRKRILKRGRQEEDRSARGEHRNLGVPPLAALHGSV